MLTKNPIVAFVLVMMMAATVFAQAYTPEPSNRVTINMGATPWKFAKGDVTGAATTTLNDAGWRTVGIPYSWSDSLSFLNNAEGGPGPGYNILTWYRKHFTLDNSYQGRKIFVEFEGAHIGAQVYINGSFIKGNSAVNPNATHVIGFLPFVVDITDSVKFGGADNVLAIKVSNAEQFYTYPHFSCDFKYGMGGGGLFRPVYMHITDKVYVPLNVYSIVNNWGTYVAAVTATEASADVKILTHVQNENGAAASVTLTTKIVDAATRVVAWSEDKTQAINAGADFVFDQTATVTNPKLWYPANSPFGRPNMYRVYHIVKVAGKTVDVFESPLGIRVITWGNDFPLINGHPHYLWGASSRYDYPALGAAVPEEVQWREVKIMADCGGNLWRPGHATASPEFSAACDAFGVMLMQPSGDIEGSFMSSQIAPWTASYKAILKRECHRDMIVRDRNNPSILAWEASNGPIDLPYSRELRHLDSLWDPVHTRAMSDRGYWLAVPSFQAGVANIVSCSGTGCEPAFHQQYPTIPTWGAEAWGGSRGYRFNYDGELSYATEYVNNWRNSKKAKCFGVTHWYMADTPGESGLGRSFCASMMDFGRIPRMLYYIYQACWTNYSVRPVVKIAHHWNRGGTVAVNAFSNCPSVRLRINGADQGIKTPYPDTVGTAMLPRQCQWSVGWQSGTVRAEGLDASGNVVCFDEIKTAGAASKIVLTVDPRIVRPDNGETFKIMANGSDAATILCTVTDANGNWCPTANNNVTFSVSGPGYYCGGADNATGGGGLHYHSPFSPELTAEGGMTRISVRSTFTAGTVTVTATSGGLAQGTATFTTVAVPNGGIITGTRQAFAPVNSTLYATIASVGGALRYFLNRPANVSVLVLDASGRTVVQVPRSMTAEGWHRLDLGGTTGKGVYFVRIAEDSGFRCVKRVMVIK